MVIHAQARVLISSVGYEKVLTHAMVGLWCPEEGRIHAMVVEVPVEGALWSMRRG